MFIEIMVKNFPKLMKNTKPMKSLQDYEAIQILSKLNSLFGMKDQIYNKYIIQVNTQKKKKKPIGMN